MPPSPHRPITGAPTDGSRTITVHDVQPRREGEATQAGSSGGGNASSNADQPQQQQLTLRLRGGPPRRNGNSRVAWDEGVIDNENCGRKKSKICCIYHKPKAFDESSDESSTSDSDSDSPSDDGRARPRHFYHHHNHNHDNNAPPDATGSENNHNLPGAAAASGGGNDGVCDGRNAYETQPLQTKKGKPRAV